MATPINPLRMHNPRGRDVGIPDGSMAGHSPMGGSGKEDGGSAGYMELEGAQKDADCSKVQVDGGVSSDRGCCNEWQDKGGAENFSCGTCAYVLPGKNASAQAGEGQAPATSGVNVPPGRAIAS